VGPVRARVGGVLVLLASLLGLSSASASAPAALPASPQAQIARIGPAPARQRIELVLPLVAKTAALQQFATAVSTPGDSHYQQFESIDQLAQRFGASARTRSRVLHYLNRAGATHIRIDRTGLFADATVSAALAQRLFETPLATFRTARGSRFTAPTLGARLPAALHGVVTGVIGLDTRPLAPQPGFEKATPGAFKAVHEAARPTSARPRTGTVSPIACAAGAHAGEVHGIANSAGFAPNQYLTAYGFDPLQHAGLKGQGQRVALIEIDGFNYSDIKAFAQCFHLDIPALNGFGVGGAGRLPAGGEATLDLEVLDAAAPDLRSIDVYEARASAAAALRAMTAPLQVRGHKPQVISASLGLCEQTLREAVGKIGIRTAESELAFAAATGTTFLASSGDQGSADCTANSGAPFPALAVNFPASSPFVTGVGGTNIALSASNQLAGQLVWNDTFVQPGSAGGGGFSRMFGRPVYQRGTVRSRHRAVPDVSMLGDIIPGYAIYCTARGVCSRSHPWTSVGGTSAGTPLLAGGLALIDEALRLDKKQALGLVNPLLYKIGRSTIRGGVFSDVVNYDNDIGPDVRSIRHSLGCCRAGPGFDAASGWGSVNINGLAAIALVAQPAIETITVPEHQRPVRSHRLMVTVGCTLACHMGAYVLVRIGHARPFEVDSRRYTLAGPGRRTIPLRFGTRRLRKLRAALRHHRRIDARAFAVALDAHNHFLSQTAGKIFRIRR
jgi:subtilase family serine protease